MARATRSSATQLQSDLKDLPPSVKSKTTTKKRKRTSLADNDDHPPPKQLRAIKEENLPDIDDDNLGATKRQHLPLAANVPIHPTDAQHILDILEL